MTDEQWVWLYANMALDNDEQLERMCPKCQDEVVSGNHCTRCGKVLDDVEAVVNPNFDRARFDRLSHGDSAEVVNSNFDKEAFDRLSEDGEQGGK